jgi:hypothetical protein
VDLLPDGLGGGQQVEQGGVVALGGEAASVCRQPADDDSGPGPVAVVGDRVGLDGGGPVGVPGLSWRGPAVDLGLQFVRLATDLG